MIEDNKRLNIVMLSYENTSFDGRLKQLIRSMSMLGQVHLFQRKTSNIDKNSTIRGKGYLSFIIEAVKFGLANKKIDILFIDNRKCILPGRIIKLFNLHALTVLDCRELYFFKDVHHLPGKIGCLIEGPFIKSADLVSAANIERAEIMRDYYKLSYTPVVFENIRSLESSEYEDDTCELFDSNCFDDEVRVISTAGCRREGFNKKLIYGMSKLQRKCRLFFAGQYTNDELEYIQSIQKQCGFDKVVLLGRLNQSALKRVVDRCHIGIVAYSNCDINTKYCASGKMYEFILEGIPVVTTTNPPLQRMCETGKIGISDDEFSDGLDQVISNYEAYKRNAISYAEKVSVEDNNRILAEQVLSTYKKKMLVK